MDYEVTDKAFVRGEVSQYPAATVEEHKHRQYGRLSGGPDDVEFYAEPVLGNVFFRNVDAGQVYVHGLGSFQDGPGLGGRKGFKGRAGSAVQCFEEGFRRDFDSRV